MYLFTFVSLWFIMESRTSLMPVSLDRHILPKSMLLPSQNSSLNYFNIPCAFSFLKFAFFLLLLVWTRALWSASPIGPWVYRHFLHTCLPWFLSLPPYSVFSPTRSVLLEFMCYLSTNWFISLIKRGFLISSTWEGFSQCLKLPLGRLPKWPPFILVKCPPILKTVSKSLYLLKEGNRERERGKIRKQKGNKMLLFYSGSLSQLFFFVNFFVCLFVLRQSFSV